VARVIKGRELCKVLVFGLKTLSVLLDMAFILTMLMKVKFMSVLNERTKRPLLMINIKSWFQMILLSLK